MATRTYLARCVDDSKPLRLTQGAIYQVKETTSDPDFVSVYDDYRLAVNAHKSRFMEVPTECSTISAEVKSKSDAVNHPSHYNQGKVECIDAIEASLSVEGYRGFLKGNALKYLWRYESKGKRVEDLEKFLWYGNRLSESEKAEIAAGVANLKKESK